MMYYSWTLDHYFEEWEIEDRIACGDTVDGLQLVECEERTLPEDFSITDAVLDAYYERVDPDNYPMRGQGLDELESFFKAWCEKHLYSYWEPTDRKYGVKQ